MLESILPVLFVLILLQLVIRFMQRKKPGDTVSGWRGIDYKKRIDLLLKGRDPDKPERVNGADLAGKTPWFEELRMLPLEMKDVRRDLNLIREAVSTSLRAKAGKPYNKELFRNPEEMFDEVVKVIRGHLNKPGS